MAGRRPTSSRPRGRQSLQAIAQALAFAPLVRRWSVPRREYADLGELERSREAARSRRLPGPSCPGLGRRGREEGPNPSASITRTARWSCRPCLRRTPSSGSEQSRTRSPGSAVRGAGLLRLASLRVLPKLAAPVRWAVLGPRTTSSGQSVTDSHGQRVPRSAAMRLAFSEVLRRAG